MLNKIRGRVNNFLNNSKKFPFIAAFASGLYPLLYYYNQNFTLLNSWGHFRFFVLTYLLIPTVVFYVLNFIFKHVDALKKYRKYVLPVLNLMLFAFLIVISTYGFKMNILLPVIVLAIVLGILLVKHLKKVIVFQLILTAFIFVKLIPDFYKYLTYSMEWLQQPDVIEEVQFKKRPNVYVIQPDGYANFSRLKKAPYNFDNSEFENFLAQNNFILYNDFRSNYSSTVSSNSSMFAMKHHYLNKSKIGVGELYNGRRIIAGDNPVISIFNNNNYKTSLILESSYLVVNRPKLYYDYCNIDYQDISYYDRGFEFKRNVQNDLKELLQKNSTSENNFYFIEKNVPGHISTYKSDSKGKIIERENYLKSLNLANVWLKETIRIINGYDANALIVIIADHGGYVGMDYMLEIDKMQTDKNIINSVFTTALAIKWPDGRLHLDDNLRSNVNLFRVLFSYLSDEESYLDNLEKDSSFAVIKEGAHLGVYEYIDEKGNIVFNKISN